MNALLIALTLTLAPRGVAILESLREATQRVKDTPSIVTTPATGVKCIPFKGTRPANLQTTRITGVYCELPNGSSEPCALEVQHLPAPVKADEVPQIPGWIDVPDAEAVDADPRATPLYPACQVAAATMQRARTNGLFRHACSSGSTCEARVVSPQDTVTWVPAPLGVTLAPGEWRGAGCILKAGVARAGWMRAAGDADETWPDECPLR